MISAALRDAKCIAREDRVICLDCRGLRDPAHDPSLRRHVGFHPCIIRDIAGHRKFSKWLHNAMGLLSDEMEMGSGSIVVVLYCVAGNHRSVGCSVILQHLLQATIVPDWKLERSLHCSEEIWRQRLCRVCPTCNASNEIRSRALLDCRNRWRMLANDDV